MSASERTQVLLEVGMHVRNVCYEYGNPYKSLPESLGILVAEFEKLKDELKADSPSPERVRAKAMDLAAVAVRIILTVDGRS
jgi:hypothetical protein